eukprot:3646608-Prorocentrum_lima.AAC.1
MSVGKSQRDHSKTFPKLSKCSSTHAKYPQVSPPHPLAPRHHSASQQTTNHSYATRNTHPSPA